jgi:hypothetical protein
MADFLGTVARLLKSGPFPDPDVSTPKLPGAGIAPPVGSPYPAGPYDPVQGAQTPTIVPWARVGSQGLKALGINHATGVQGDNETGSAVDGGPDPNPTPLAFDSADFNGFVADSIATPWFDKWHVFPGRLDLGNVLSTQVRTLEIINNFRTESRTWQAFVNNAGAGISITNLPGLPLVFFPLSSFVNNVQVSTAGPPTIFGTLDFDIDLDPPNILSVEITGNRISIFAYRPQSPILETLEFKTDIIPANDGSEQRINVREAPRQRIQMKVRTDDDRTRDSINALLYDWQARVFGVPVWWEAKPLGAAVLINDTLLVVDTTNADFRAGGLVMIYDSNFVNEVLEIQSLTAGDITLDVGLGRAYDAVNTLVIPVRTALTKTQLSQARYAIGPTDFSLEFTTLDNIRLNDASAFATYQGVGQTVAKPFIRDRFNFLKGATIGEGIRRKVTRLDPETGPPLQFSPWAKGKPQFGYGFEADTFEEVFDFRQLLHELNGSQLSFYVGTGRDDIKVTVDIPDLATNIDFENIGFTLFIQNVTPRSDIQIIRTDGTLSQHQVTGSSIIDDDTERLTISPAVTPALPVAEIERVEFITLNRISDDRPTFSHQRPGRSRIDMKLTGVPS